LSVQENLECHTDTPALSAPPIRKNPGPVGIGAPLPPQKQVYSRHIRDQELEQTAKEAKPTT